MMNQSTIAVEEIDSFELEHDYSYEESELLQVNCPSCHHHFHPHQLRDMSSEEHGIFHTMEEHLAKVEEDEDLGGDTEERRKRRLSYSFFSLPDAFGEPDVGNCIGIDFGGTLTKIVFFQPDELPETAKTIADFVTSTIRYGSTGERDLHLSFKSTRLKGTFHFIRFQSRRTLGALKVFRSTLNNMPKQRIKIIQGTGGGAHKYKDIIEKEVGVKIAQNDELKTAVNGLVFTLLEDPETECYTYVDYNQYKDSLHGSTSHKSSNSTNISSTSFGSISSIASTPEEEPTTGIGGWKRIRQRSGSMELDMVKVSYPILTSGARNSLFPFIVVNIGSGVSILKVDSPDSFERVSGTALGGATYLGLCRLLCKCKDFNEAMKLAEAGDDRTINLLVEDIYGGPYEVKSLNEENPAATTKTSHNSIHSSPFVAQSVPHNLSSLRDVTLEESNSSETRREKRRKSLKSRSMPNFSQQREDQANQGFVLKGDHTAAFFGKCVTSLSTDPNNSSSSRSDVTAPVTINAPLSVSEKLLLFTISVLCAFHVSTALVNDLETSGHVEEGASGISNLLVAFMHLSLLLLPAGLYKLIVFLKQQEATTVTVSEEKEGRGDEENLSPEDISKALVVMISQNITQIAFLNAKLYQLDKVIFTGSFLRHNDIAHITLAKNIKIWSNGEMSALFMEHEGYFGALGAFLSNFQQEGKTQS